RPWRAPLPSAPGLRRGGRRPRRTPRPPFPAPPPPVPLAHHPRQCDVRHGQRPPHGVDALLPRARRPAPGRQLGEHAQRGAVVARQRGVARRLPRPHASRGRGIHQRAGRRPARDPSSGHLSPIAMSRSLHRIAAASAALALAGSAAPAQPPLPRPAASFIIEEATIAELHAAMRAGALSCRQLVQGYLRRIEAYDKNGPALNALILVNPAALATADSLDRRYAREGFVGPLHCVPTIVKDNFETIDLPTTAGLLALRDWRPTRDATQVQRIRAAGAIVLAKSNMAELAFSPNETVSSVLAGYSKNPYALDRVTAGSSGGTAAAVAASFGAVGLGS